MTIPILPPEVARLRDEALSHFRQWHDNNQDSIRVGFEAALNALAHLSASAAAQGETKRVEVFSAPGDDWILMPRHLTEAWATYAQGAFMDYAWSATECFAARYAELIKITEAARQKFVASHPAPPASASAPRAQEEAVGLTTLTVRTRHPADYVLENDRDGTRWRGTDEGRWTAVHEGGEDGELLHGFNRDDLAAMADGLDAGYEKEVDGHESTTAAVAKFIRASLASRAQPAAASAAVPSGWKLVPDTATHRMLNAANAGRKKGRSSSGDIYRAMLAAAPDVPPAEVDIQAEVDWLKGQIEAMPAEVAQAAPVDALPELREAFAHALTSVYVCGRVWSAWSYGTMTKDDFTPGAECDELLDGLVHVAAQALVRATPRVEAKPLTEEEVWRNDGLMEANAVAGLPLDQFLLVVRATERAHGIGTHPEETGNV